ncbi:UDP-N-acetylmuramoyl-L-alanyl-D-glutamate--2,6-diaminopimelate ligase [Clostridiales Family XIII bacterium PM5-7]
MQLSKIFLGQPDIEIEGLCIDSRKVKPGDVFFCLKGLETDGHRYAEKACELGAVAIVHSDELHELAGITYIKVEDTNEALNQACDIFFDHPSKRMTVFGVTGTNGKTTTTSIISDVYSNYKPCGYMGTIAVRYGNVSRIPSLTTPDALEIHGNLKEMVDHGMEAVAMEVSSHGLAMRRVDSVDFDYAIFTNLTYDHLDYHKTMEQYFEAKKILFENMKPSGVALLNVDDDYYEALVKGTSCKVLTYGVKASADYRAEEVKISTTGTEFTLVHEGKRYPVKTNLIALYNLYNLLGAIGAMHQSGMSLADMIPLLEHIAQVDGRMEQIDCGQPFNVIVDYAHTPDGFEKVFQYAKEITKGKRTFAVFGSAGKRDKVKRKILGQIADKYCDKVFVTEEDPRNESAEDIGKEILTGIDEGKGVFISDRFEAIKAALEIAETGDCVLILGKGDEPYMYYEYGRAPWMGDHQAAKKVLEKEN